MILLVYFCTQVELKIHIVEIMLRWLSQLELLIFVKCVDGNC